jgi:RNA polymerase sigma-70 factor, ECF subfamily
MSTRASEVSARRRTEGQVKDVPEPNSAEGAGSPGATLRAVPVRSPPFAQIYEQYFPFTWRMARRLGTPESNLDDVVQEIFIVTLRRLPEFEGRSSIKTWLYGIVINVVRAHRRRLLVTQPHALNEQLRADPAALTDPQDGPHERTAKAEAARVVDQLLDALDDDKRQVFVLIELEQATAPEVAAILQLPLNTVYSRLRLAREEFAAAAARGRAREERSRR